MLRSRNVWRAVPMGFAALSVLLLGAMPLQAAPIVWNLTEEFSGGAAPDGKLTVELVDTAEDTVQLTVDATALFGTEFVSELCLNLDPGLNPNLLSFSGPGWSYVAGIATGVDAFKPDGDGLFDIQITFLNSPPKNRLGAGKEAVFSITGIDGLTEGSFNFLSTPAGGHGPFSVAAHVQGIDHGEGSGWVTTGDGDHPIPEASTMLLFGSGLTGVLAAARRKIRF